MLVCKDFIEIRMASPLSSSSKVTAGGGPGLGNAHNGFPELLLDARQQYFLSSEKDPGIRHDKNGFGRPLYVVNRTPKRVKSR